MRVDITFILHKVLLSSNDCHVARANDHYSIIKNVIVVLLKSGAIVVVSNVADSHPFFGQIADMYKNEKCDGTEVKHFAAKIELLNSSFNEHFHAYEINEGHEYKLLNLKDLCSLKAFKTNSIETKRCIVFSR